MSMLTYQVEVTAFGAPRASREFETPAIEVVAEAVDSVPPEGGVIFVAALTSGVDHGNFYLFRNEAGFAYVVLHEHREFMAHDPHVQASTAVLVFRGEDGESFQVQAAFTTSWERGKQALLHWLPAQAHWPELVWE
jgi:hypothetical protein